MLSRRALLSGIFLAALIAISWPASAPPAQAAATAGTYRITITNLSNEQPLSPPILATHSPMKQLIEPGSMASEGLRKLAEEGQNLDLAQEWRNQPEITQVIAGEAPLGRRGTIDTEGPAINSATFEIQAGAGDVLTIAAMLGCTNDGFAGLVSMALPDSQASIFMLPSNFDAGTELNTEKSVDLADSCAVLGAQSLPEDDGNGHIATSLPILLHPGLNLTGDLTQASAWSGPVMQIKVERIDASSEVAVAPSAPPRTPFVTFTPPGNDITTSSTTYDLLLRDDD
jgi:hypothetical protein